MDKRTLIPPGLLAVGVTVLAGFTAGQPPHGGARVPQDGANIAGTWVLNRDDSDDPGEAVQEAMQEAMQGSAAQRGGRTRGGASGGRPTGTRDPGAVGVPPEQMQRIQTVMREAARAAQRLVIEQTDSTVVVTTDRGQRVLFSDDRKIEATAPNGVDMELKAKWDGDKLKVETKWDGGVRITEEYEIKDDQLNVNLRIEATRPRIRARINLVYDAAT